MALPDSGQISLSQVNTEFGRASNSTHSLDTGISGGYGTVNTNSPHYPNATNPDSISEWYGYNHSTLATGVYGNAENGQGN